jgi:hypothetical protein
MGPDQAPSRSPSLAYTLGCFQGASIGGTTPQIAVPKSSALSLKGWSFIWWRTVSWQTVLVNVQGKCRLTAVI